MRVANEELEQAIAADPHANVAIDYISDEEQPYIEMDIATVPLSEAEKIEKIDDTVRVDGGNEGGVGSNSSSSSSSSRSDTGLTPRMSGMLPNAKNGGASSTTKKEVQLIEVMEE
jgi:hypothetical protein